MALNLKKEIKMKNAYAGAQRGTNEENRIVSGYGIGESGDFAIDWMRNNIHPTDIVFNARAFSPKVAIKGFTDGIYFDGNKLDIIELKSGKRYAKKYYAQVVRYAFAMMHSNDYAVVELHIVYSDLQEVDTFKFNREDIPAEYAKVKGDEGKKGNRKPKRVASAQTLANRRARKQLTKLRNIMQISDWTLPESELTIENVNMKMLESVQIQRGNRFKMDAKEIENYLFGNARSLSIPPY